MENERRGVWFKGVFWEAGAPEASGDGGYFDPSQRKLETGRNKQRREIIPGSPEWLLANGATRFDPRPVETPDQALRKE